MAGCHRNQLVPIESQSVGDGPIPFFLLNYVKLVDYFPASYVIDATVDQPYLPFPIDHPLYKKWEDLLETTESDILPVLVAIPRGGSGNFQVMTGSVRVSEDLETRTQDPMQFTGIRWLHCK